MEAEYYLSNSLAANTRAAYSTGAKKYLLYCQGHGVVAPWPASQLELCVFAVREARTLSSEGP